MARGEYDLEKTGNWREIQTIDKHGVAVVSSSPVSEEEEESRPSQALILVIMLVVNMIVMDLAYVGMKLVSKKQEADKQSEMGKV